MLNNRKIQVLGATVLILAAVLVILSAVNASAQASTPVIGSNPEGMVQYQSEGSVCAQNDLMKNNQNGQYEYNRIERNLIGPYEYNRSEHNLIDPYEYNRIERNLVGPYEYNQIRCN